MRNLTLRSETTTRLPRFTGDAWAFRLIVMDAVTKERVAPPTGAVLGMIATVEPRCPLMSSPVQLTTSGSGDELLWLLDLPRETTELFAAGGRLRQTSHHELALQVRFGSFASGDTEQSLELLFPVEVGTIGSSA